MRASGWKNPVWLRFRARPRAVFGLVIVLAYLLAAVFAPWVAPFDPVDQDLSLALKGPRPGYWLGNDEYGRDVLSRIIYGARLSFLIGTAAVAIALVGGGLLGVVAGYRGGWADNLIMRCMDVMLAFPSFLLALAIVSILGPGIVNLIVAIGVFSIPTFARVARGAVLSVVHLDYVEAARSSGAGDWRIIWRYVIPNSMAPLIVLSTMRMATAIITASGLSFLGLGAQPPTPEWGAMLSTGREYLRAAPHVATVPGLAIMFLVLGFNLFGDGLRDALDPRLKV
ncbi:MAG: ABC transporter permease [Bacillota bacterium]|nr:ABC transporter permease [Bacillota bacterium]